MIKESIYDIFECTADKCPLTCCKGWAVKVEEADLDKWKKDASTNYLCEAVTKRKANDGFNMKMDIKKGCIMLDECGLCNIVKKHGDEALSKTCQDFPRKINEVREYIDEDLKGEILLEELSLSGGCPHVLELLLTNEEAVADFSSLDKKDITFPYEYKVRNLILDLFKDNSKKLYERMLLAISFLHECLECEYEEDVYSLIETYKEKENLDDIILSIHENQIDETEAFFEICQTFFDVTEYYKEEEMYKPYLKYISEYCEKIEENIEKLTPLWNKFKKDYEKYDEYMSRILSAEIFSDCISDDLGEIIENIQCIILEYLMTRVSLFYKEQLGESIDIKTMQLYMSLYIRMIGHNIEGVCEYWSENFEDSILDIDYMNTLIC